MEYLNYVLGIHVSYKEDSLYSMPNYILSRYQVQEVELNGNKAVFVYPRKELESISSVKKHMERVERTAGVPPVLVLSRLTYRQKEYLLRDRIPFVVDGKQIYLPFMAIYLQERSDSEKKAETMILPSAQMLLLYFIYHGCEELLTGDAARALSLTATSVSRASGQLQEFGLVKTEKRGVHKVLLSDMTPRELFEKSEQYLKNPIKRIIYVRKEEIREEPLMSGYTALSEYSMLNPSSIRYFATESISKWEKSSTKRLQNSDDQYAIELWRYDPKRLSYGKCVDELSLALALREDEDERIQEAVEEMLMKLWGDIHDKRN